MRQICDCIVGRAKESCPFGVVVLCVLAEGVLIMVGGQIERQKGRLPRKMPPSLFSATGVNEENNRRVEVI